MSFTPAEFIIQQRLYSAPSGSVWVKVRKYVLHFVTAKGFLIKGHVKQRINTVWVSVVPVHIGVHHTVSWTRILCVQCTVSGVSRAIIMPWRQTRFLHMINCSDTSGSTANNKKLRACTHEMFIWKDFIHTLCLFCPINLNLSLRTAMSCDVMDEGSFDCGLWLMPKDGLWST